MLTRESIEEELRTTATPLLSTGCSRAESRAYPCLQHLQPAAQRLQFLREHGSQHAVALRGMLGHRLRVRPELLGRRAMQVDLRRLDVPYELVTQGRDMLHAVRHALPAPDRHRPPRALLRINSRGLPLALLLAALLLCARDARHLHAHIAGLVPHARLHSRSPHAYTTPRHPFTPGRPALMTERG